MTTWASPLLLLIIIIIIILSLCSAHQKKILVIDDHVGISIAGLTADARTISRSPITIKYVQNSKRSWRDLDGNFRPSIWEWEVHIKMA